MSKTQRYKRSTANMIRNHAGRPMPVQVQITAGDTIERKCGCGGEIFDTAYRIRVLPRISPKNPTGRDQVVKVETFVCRSCGKELGNEPEDAQAKG